MADLKEIEIKWDASSVDRTDFNLKMNSMD